MGYGSQSVEFIRQFFRQSEFHRPPFTPATAYGGMSTSSYSSYGMEQGGFQGVNDYLRVDSDLVAKYIDYEDMDENPIIASCLDIYCLAGDTMIPLLDGRTIPIKQLATMSSSDNLWVYSCNGSKIVPAKIKSAQRTGILQKVLKLTLDDGSIICATPSHKFMMRSGEFVELQNLKPGDSLMPLYRKIDKRGYERTFDGTKSVLTHRLAFESLYGYLPKNINNKPEDLRVLHHIDFHKRNNNPTNAGFKNWTDFKENILGITKHHNHKVVSVEECKDQVDVYDLTVEGDNHCFAAGDGNGFVIVHNSDDSSQVDSQTGKSVWIEAEDEDIREELENLLHKTLQIEERVWGDLRLLNKYGNIYLELVVKDSIGVIAANALPPPTVRRIEVPKQIGKDINKQETEEEINWDTLGYIYDPRGLFKINTKQFIDELKYRCTGEATTGEKSVGCSVFESWEIVHMRLMGKSPYSLYGVGIPESARWIFKRLLLLEDSIILHRLTRAPSRFAFYIDVSGIPPNETQAYLNKVKQGIKKQKFVNPGAGNKIDQRYSVMAGDEDFFLSMRDGKESTRVDSLQGPIYDHIEDVKFFEDKLFAALKVPKPFLTYEESTAKTHLSAEDARFARTVIRVQREYRNGWKKICKVHLAAKGINPESVPFDVCMSVPSAIFELSQLEIRAAELDLAGKYDGWANKKWIKSHVLGWSDDQIRESTPEDENEPVGGGGGGDIEKALSKRGSPKSTPSKDSDSAPPGETKVFASDGETVGAKLASNPPPRRSEILLGHVKKNTDQLLERITKLETLRDKTSIVKLDKIVAELKEIRHSQDRDRK